jgi:phosphoribosylanthranilate isomerase
VTPIIKVCGLTRREDAVAAIDAGATAIGFVFYPPSPRCVTPDRAAEIAEGLNTCKVGIFVEETAATVEAVMRSAKLDVAQIYGGSAPHGARQWHAMRMTEGAPVPSSEGAEAILLDGAQSGSTFDWSRARGAAARVIIAGGLDGSNVAEAIRAAEPWGVDASSRLESAPGIKDHEKIRRFVAAARKAFAC